MSLYGEIQRFDPDSIVVVYVVYDKAGDVAFRFHSGVNEYFGNLVWQGQEYVALPIETEGFDLTSDKFPRPKIRVGNFQGAMSDVVVSYDDLIGYKVVRKKTLSRYLDAANFPDGNPNANPLEEFADEIFYVVQKTQESKMFVEFELGSALDIAGVALPQRQAIATVCCWRYRSEECGYTGGAVATANDYPTTDLSQDKCSKKVSGCKLRFGDNGDLRFGAFVGMRLINT